MKKKLWVASILLVLLQTLVLAEGKVREIELMSNKKSLSLNAALLLSKDILGNCQKTGYQVSVTVVDIGGNILVSLKDDLSSSVFSDAATKKAKTALAFRTTTSQLTKSVNSNKEVSGIKHLSDILILGGGVPIFASGSMIGAAGVAGAPDGNIDEKCATYGVEKIQEILEFAE